MAGFQKSIAINAPVEKVFDFVKYPRNLPEIWSSLVEVRDVKQNPDRGFNYGWVYKMEDQNLKEHLKSLNISPTNGLQPGAAKASTTALAGHLKKQIMYKDDLLTVLKQQGVHGRAEDDQKTIESILRGNHHLLLQ